MPRPSLLLATAADGEALDAVLRGAEGEQEAWDLGRAAAILYVKEPETLPHGGLGTFSHGSSGRVLARRALVRSPRAARTLHTAAQYLPARGPRARLRRVSLDAFFWRGVRASVDAETWRRLKSGVTILMYHAFCVEREPASVYVLPGRQFARQLTLLRLLRRRVVSLDSYLSLRGSHTLPPARTVVITIDDGYDDVYDVAAPVLARHGYPATVFAVTGRVGMRADWPPEGPLRDRPLAGWQRLRQGLANGIDIGAHSRTHPRLTELTDEEAAEEIDGSRRDLSHGLRPNVPCFAYPGGDEDTRMRRLVTHAGFQAACTSRMGKNGPCEPLERLRRVEIRGDQGLSRFILAVTLGRPTLGRRRPSPRDR